MGDCRSVKFQSQMDQIRTIEKEDQVKAFLEVVITNPGGGTATVRNAVDLPFAPYPGMEVECSAWKFPRPVKGTTLSLGPDPKELCLYIYLGTDEAGDTEEQHRLVESYKGHGWNLLC
jgi:hypothetical protein